MRGQSGVGETYSTGAAARQLGISRFTLLRAVRRGEIQPAHQTPGGYFRFDPATVQAYAARMAPAQPMASARRRAPRVPAEHRGHAAQREKRLSTLYATMASGVLVITADGRLTDVNDAARHLLGLQDTTCGAHILGRVLVETRDARGALLPIEERPMQRALATGQPQRNRVVGITRRDGLECWLQVDAVPVVDATGVTQEVVVSFVDVTARQEAETALRAQFESLPLPTYIWQRCADDWVLRDYNPAAVAYSRGAMTNYRGHTAQECYRGRPDILADFTRCWTERRTIQRELPWTRTTTGEPAVLIVTYVFVTPDGIMVHTDDVTDQRVAEQALQASEQRYRALSEQATDMVGILDTQGRIRYVSASVQRLLGYTPEEVCGQNGFTFLHPEDIPPMEQAVATLLKAPGAVVQSVARFRHRDGSWRTFEVINRNQVHDPAIGGIVFNQRDITERVQAEESLRRQAFHDTLTGLPNRALLFDRGAQAVSVAERTGGSVALLLLDMNGFKDINDTFGHAYGDRVLRRVAVRLQRIVRARDTVARLGGDEFALLLADEDQAGALQVAERIAKAFARPLVLEGHQFHVGASVGIALYPAHGSDVQALVHRADVAMYASKRSGAGPVLYAAEHEQGIPDRLALVEDLRAAVHGGALVLHYQPKVALTTGTVASLEALVRWVHPQRGLIPPGQFIPLAEQTGLIVPLTQWVLAEAARQWQAWEGRAASIAVNLSATNLQDPRLVETVTEVLARSGMPASALRLEVTESALLADTSVGCAVLGRLQALGIGLSVDDYGSGYSSLAYLKHLPVDELKIDMTFVRHMAEDQADAAIVASTVGLGHSLGLQVVAEGVEDQATWELLQTMGCDIAQGYHLSRPLPASDLEAWLQHVSDAA